MTRAEIVPLSVRLNDAVTISWADFADVAGPIWDRGQDTVDIARALAVTWQTPVAEHVVANKLPALREYRRAMKRAA